MAKANKIWLLLDGKFRTDEDGDICCDACDTLEEAMASEDDYETDTVIVECELNGDLIVKPRIIN